jgi:hypothetical protein
MRVLEWCQLRAKVHMRMLKMNLAEDDTANLYETWNILSLNSARSHCPQYLDHVMLWNKTFLFSKELFLLWLDIPDCFQDPSQAHFFSLLFQFLLHYLLYPHFLVCLSWKDPENQVRGPGPLCNWLHAEPVEVTALSADGDGLCVLKKQGGRVWTGFIWLRIQPRGGFF